MTIEQLALSFSDQCRKYINFIRIDVERLTNYRKSMFSQMERVVEAFIEHCDFFDSTKAKEFVFMLYNYLAGLYPRMNPTPEQMEAIQSSGESDFFLGLDYYRCSSGEIDLALFEYLYKVCF